MRKVRRGLCGAAILLGIVLFAVLCGWESWQSALAERRQGLAHQLAVFGTSLEQELQRAELVPYVVSFSPRVQRLLADPDSQGLREDVSRYLSHINAETGAALLFLMDVEGRVIASSNWEAPSSLVGHDYGFRPYFRDALAGGVGRFYGVGMVTRRPGAYIARPVYLDGLVSGVVVIKQELDSMESMWALGGSQVVVADSDGVVVLSSRGDWRYSTVRPLSDEARRRRAAAQQYLAETLLPLSVSWQSSERISVEGRDYLLRHDNIARMGWQMGVMEDLGGLRRQAWLTGSVAGFALLALTLAALYLRQRLLRLRERLAAQATLERTVAERTTELANANLRLQEEIGERCQAEAVLRETQAELLRAGKLAALGQMAASVAHELAQPLAALRGFTDNTRLFLERRRYLEVDANLGRILAQTDKLGLLTSQLKLFATRRPVAGYCKLAALRPSLDAALALHLRAAGACLHWDVPEHCPVPLEPLALEQMLGNLLRNAIDAVRGQPRRDICVSARVEPGWLRLQVSDSGIGLPPGNPAQVFEPFYSTKGYGDGLGLGLAIAAGIVRDAGGDIAASPMNDGGACFTVSLPLDEDA